MINFMTREFNLMKDFSDSDLFYILKNKPTADFSQDAI